MTLTDLGILFKFFGGLGLFVYGMNVMADGLQKSAGSKLKNLLGFLTKNRLVAILVGTGITAVIQSSSATTVMVVGFVNAGMMSLAQAVGVIMGANIGTTVTAWIVSMNEWGSIFKPEFFAPILVGIGSFQMLFAKSENKKRVAEILVGFGVLFIGLDFMSGSIAPYRDAPIFANAFAILGKEPFLAILAGLVVTAIIQSSSASVGILQMLAMNGIVTWRSAIFITLGQNIGTCVTALLACMGANKNAKRAAVIHLLFNTIGAVIFGIIMYILFLFNTRWANSDISMVQISVFHTVFNVLNTMILFPFANGLVKLSQRIIRDTVKDNREETVVAAVARRLDRRILTNPSFAIETVVREISFMGELALQNTKRAMEAVFSEKKSEAKEVYKTEEDIDQLEKQLTAFLVEVSNLSLTEEQHMVVKNLFYTISDVERIGDHSENIAQLADQKRKDKVTFSAKGEKDMEGISELAISALESALNARKNADKGAAKQTLDMEVKVNELKDELREKHILRLSKGKCKPESGVIFLDIVSNLERISDHADNIAGYVLHEG